ncbi:zinc-dependent alcohol dehydrogenase [Phytohabitans houttuyneae]|nr:alcohol dehydrogenase catalytic domain-containing protein [Phytohabitans houttuyneae]
MPQLVLNKPGDADWTEVAVPRLRGDGEALVRPVAVATCDLDTAINAGVFPMELPYAVGHEFVAEVVEVSGGVRTVRPGDVVAVPFQISCGRCGRCLRRQTRDCASVPPSSMYGLGTLGGPWGGALTDLVRVPYADAMLLALPPGVAPATVASLDNLPDAWRAVAPHLRGDDRRVLVVGRQSIGLYAVAVARALDADVTYVDTSATRLGIAERLGATPVQHVDGLRLERYPVTVSTDATPEGIRLALGSTARGGVCTDTGIFPGDVRLPLRAMYMSGVTLVTARADARSDLPEVLALVADGRLDPSVVTADVVPWEEAAHAWSNHAGKLVVTR